ncbi:MAG: TolC family protein [Gemmataceae bacterium]|nr:TolC family protein [Gemmataceae bacterium]MCI0739153.1 TolC family protein [Gemmataceae bacterium]
MTTSARIGTKILRNGLLTFAVLWTAGSAWAQVKSPAAKLTLPELINLGLEKQPALAAARASLAGAHSGQAGVSNMPLFARLFAPDLPVRRQQAHLGVTIAAAALEQAEWETRYAVVRNYYSIQFARMQLKVIESARGKLERARTRAEELLKKGVLEFKITRIDVDMMSVAIELVKAKEAEARTGILKATAALREALGVGLDYPLDVVEAPLPERIKGPNKEDLIAQALANRGEMTQVSTAQQVTQLEIAAQSRMLFTPQGRTFAAASDIHVQPIPQGVANGEYRPGALGLEMPSNLVGRRPYRVQRASNLNDRALAVVDKTHNLITLEVEATYLKWLEADEKVTNLKKVPEMARQIAKDVDKRFNEGHVSGEELMRARTLEDQVQATYNEALYQHALALAALERVTAGGFRITAIKE